MLQIVSSEIVLYEAIIELRIDAGRSMGCLKVIKKINYPYTLKVITLIFLDGIAVDRMEMVEGVKTISLDPDPELIHHV